jgi:hypothetical protein
MPMADVYEWPTRVVLELNQDQDPELSCFLCGGSSTDMSFDTLLGGTRTTRGVHAECVKGLRG